MRRWRWPARRTWSGDGDDDEGAHVDDNDVCVCVHVCMYVCMYVCVMMMMMMMMMMMTMTIIIIVTMKRGHRQRTRQDLHKTDVLCGFLCLATGLPEPGHGREGPNEERVDDSVDVRHHVPAKSV